jgi:hypothetical protein
MRNTIRTTYATTVSMSLEEGLEFMNSNETLQVYSKFNKSAHLGYITAEHFRENKTIRLTGDGLTVYVCTYTKK